MADDETSAAMEKEGKPKHEVDKMDDDGSESEEGDIYEVEKIVDMTKSKGKTLYRVRWAGYGSNWDTWEPITNLDSCKDMVNRFRVTWHKQAEDAQKEAARREAALQEEAEKEKTKEVVSDASDDSESLSSGGHRKKSKKHNYFYVDEEDDQADTLKDKFWRDLEQGKINVFGNDMYSKVKGQGRSSRPVSFRDMFKNGPAQGTSDDDEKKYERRPLKRQNSSSSLGSSTKSGGARRKKSRSSSRSSSVSGRRASSETLSQNSDREVDSALRKPSKSRRCTIDSNVSDKKGSRGKLKGGIKVEDEDDDNWVSKWKVSGGSDHPEGSTCRAQLKVPVVVVRRVSDGLSVANIKQEPSDQKDTSSNTAQSPQVVEAAEVMQLPPHSLMATREPVPSVIPASVGASQHVDSRHTSATVDSTIKVENPLDASGGTWATSPIPVMDGRRRYSTRETEKPPVKLGSSYSTYNKHSRFAPLAVGSRRQPGTVEDIRQTWMKKDPKILSCSVIVSDVQKTQCSRRDMVVNCASENTQKEFLAQNTLDLALTQEPQIGNIDRSGQKDTPPVVEGVIPNVNPKDTEKGDEIESGCSRLREVSPPRPIPVHISVSPNPSQRVGEDHPEFQHSDAAEPDESQTITEVTGRAPLSTDHLCPSVPTLTPVTKPEPVKPSPQSQMYTPTPVYTPTPIAKLAATNSQTPVGVSIPEHLSQLGDRAHPKQSPNKPSDAYIPGQLAGLPAVDDQGFCMGPQHSSPEGGSTGQPEVNLSMSVQQSESIDPTDSYGSMGSHAETHTLFSDIRNRELERGLDWVRENSDRVREGCFQSNLDPGGIETGGTGRLRGGGKGRGHGQEYKERPSPASLQSRGNDPQQGPSSPAIPQGNVLPSGMSGPPVLTRAESYGPPTPAELPVFGDDPFNPFNDFDMRRNNNSNTPGNLGPVGSRGNVSHGGTGSQRGPAGYPYSPYQATSTGSPAGWSVSTPSPGTPGSSSGIPQALGTPGGSSSKLIGEETAFDFDLTEIEPAIWEQKDERMPDTPELSAAELKNAVRNNDYERVRRAMLRRKRYDLEMHDEAGVSLLMMAAARGYDDVLELLVINGANFNARSKNGISALMLACENGHRCTSELLLIMGAHMNVQQATGETALIKAVKCGNKHIVRLLLDHGANFTSPSYTTDITAIRVAKQRNYTEILEILNGHISWVTADFENQVMLTLNNTAQIQCALFPMQCFALGEADHFTITFSHELQPTRPGVGMLLFIAHARITSTEVRCRFYGPCAVTSSVLNGYQLSPLTEEANFVMSFSPLYDGRNELEIKTVKAPTSRAKLVVCAYKAQLALPPD